MDMITSRLHKARCENPRSLKRKNKASRITKDENQSNSEIRAATRDIRRKDAMSRGLRSQSRK